MIITKEDVGRRVRLSNGEEDTIDRFNAILSYPVTCESGIVFDVDGKYWKNEDNYIDRNVEPDIIAFVADSSTTEQIRESLIYKHLPLSSGGTGNEVLSDPCIVGLNEHFESKDKNISFTIPENTVNMELEINGYRINVTKL